jgi:SAM-dependent methyltransferase
MSADHPNAEAWNDYLREFHRAIPDATSSSIGRFTNAAGKTTYRLLAETLSENAATSGTVRVLDLGCGDGRLVDEIAAVLGARAAIAGLDLSHDEIERARSRGRPGRYLAGPAGAMPFEARSFDAVLSHFAFMLMQPVDGVVREIERVLEPGGFFATAVSWLARSDGDLAALLALRREASHGMTAPVHPSFDPRQTSTAGFSQLFADAGSRRVFSERRERVGATVDADGAWHYLATLYFSEALDAPARAALRARVDHLTRERGGSLTLTQDIDIVTLRGPIDAVTR